MLLLVGLMVLGGGFGRTADPQKQAADTSKPAKDEWAGKTVKFDMRDKPWGQVLEWLADLTGVPVILIKDNKPTGTFTYIAPKNGPKEYTIPQVIDILNQSLEGQNYLLIRRSASFTIVRSDQKIDPAMVPRISIDDLKQHGDTEYASVVLPLKALMAEDEVKEVDKMMGPFGTAVAMTEANQLVLQDTVGNLKRVIKTIQDYESMEKGQASTLTYKCRYIKAREAEKILKELLGDPEKLLRLTQPQQPQFPFNFGRGGNRFDGGQQPQAAPQPAAAAPKIRMHYITIDERLNTVLVTGPANKIAQAEQILQKIDVKQGDQPEVIGGAPFLKIYAVPAGNAPALVAILKEQFTNTAVRITDGGSSSILVWAGPEDQIQIGKQILGGGEKNAKTELFKLTVLDAASAAKTLTGMFGESKTGAPYVEADAARNALVVKGTQEQIDEVKLTLKSMGELGTSGGNLRIINLENGSATTLAEALGRMLPQMRQNPVKVTLPGNEPRRPAPEKKEPPKKEPPQGEEEQDQGTEATPQKTGGPSADPQQQKPATEEKPGRKNAPINITVLGNKLVVTSDDPEALDLVQDLVRLYTQAPEGKGDFEIIKLKNANAVEVAKILDEAFNGVKANAAAQPLPFGGNPFFNQFRGQQAAPAPVANAIPPVRVVADPATNSLLVKASPLDMLRIRRLLESIDADVTESRAAVKPWIIPLKHAIASQVASIIKDVYREHINNNPSATTVGGFPGFGFGRRGGAPLQQNVDANGNPRGVDLSVGIDDTSNRLIVSCSEKMYKEIETLVGKLDMAAKDTTRTVRVVSFKGDPVLAQQAIDAIMGRRAIQPNNMNNLGRPGFFPNGPGFGGGGFGGQGMGGNRNLGGGGFGGGGFGGGGPGGGFQGGGFGGGQGPRGGVGGPGVAPGGGAAPPGNRQSRSDGGPDFFAQPVTDDRRTSVLFDPQQTPRLTEFASAGTVASGQWSVARGEKSPSSSLATGEVEEQQAPPATGDIQAPRSNVTAEALPDIGAIVISGSTPEDVEAVVKILEYIQRLEAAADVQIQLVPLEHADATSVTNKLNQLYQRVLFGVTSNIFTQPVTRTTTTFPLGGLQTQATQNTASVVLLPLPRQNSILVAAPVARMKDIVQEIKRLDIPTALKGQATPFSLKKASAARVASLVQNFYAQRYPDETDAMHQIRVTYDDSTNTIFVQAAPADMDEIRGLVERIDSTVSSAVNDLRIYHLRNALADEMSNLLVQAISEGIVPPTQAAGAGAGLGARGGPGAPITGLPGALPTTTTTGAGGITTKTVSLRFISPYPGQPNVESGFLEDIHITADIRTNSLIISAPGNSMNLLTALIKELDVVPANRAEVNIFHLRKSDATTISNMLQQLFLGTGGLGAGARPTTGAPLGGGGLPGGGPTGFGGLPTTPTTAGLGTAAAGAGALPRQVFMIPGAGVAEGASLVQLSIVPDQRTNSIVVAGSRNDLDVVTALIARLEGSDTAVRQFRTYKLQNAAAADLAASLTTFLNNSLAVFTSAGLGTSFQILDNDAIVVAEPVSNSLLISATPRLYAEVIEMIQRLDIALPEVVIQVLVAEVDLNNTEEFGVEIGLQSPVLFQRGIIPANNLFGTGSVTYATPTMGTSTLVAPGVTVNNSLNPAAVPGFNFNSTGPLGNNPVVGPGLVGFQGLGNLGTGRISPNSNVGGFVFSAASDAFNLLIRALKTQGRIDIMSRPQIMTLDNQTAYINVGSEIPIVTSSNVTATGIITTNIDRRQVGVILQVTPKINPDGSVLMRIVPEVSAVVPTPVQLGNGLLGTALTIQHLETTVLAQDGETVALGGLISKSDSKSENKIPVLGDLPLIGAAFRYRQELKSKKELLIILTPHVVHAPCDADHILAVESQRINWNVGDVVKYHGTTGLDPILGGSHDPGLMNLGPGGVFPAGPPVLPPPGLQGVEIGPKGTQVPPIIPPMIPSMIPPAESPDAAPVAPPPGTPGASAKPVAGGQGPVAREEKSPSSSLATSHWPLATGEAAVLSNPAAKPAELPKILPASLSTETQADNPRPPTVNILSVRSDPSGSAGASAGTSGSDPAPPGKESWKWRLFHKQ
jgi:type II secretion system protein D